MQRPELRRLGETRSPVVIIDDFTGRTDAWRAEAVRLAPFPAAKGQFYPGLRREFGARDEAASAMVDQLLHLAAPFIGGAFDYDHFELLQASFSMVTTTPEALQPVQRAPHFDSPDPNYIALLLYLCESTGTAVYRHRKTGIEKIDAANMPSYVGAAEAENRVWPRSGYILGSDDFYEQIGVVIAKPDRLAIYQGAALHSGIISPGLNLSSDPLKGRLTLNIFIRGH